MNIVVVGYGRVGSTLSRDLINDGHTVTIIDNKSERVQRAVRLVGARVVAGNAVDVQVQREANVAADINYGYATTAGERNVIGKTYAAPTLLSYGSGSKARLLCISGGSGARPSV